MNTAAQEVQTALEALSDHISGVALTLDEIRIRIHALIRLTAQTELDEDEEAFLAALTKPPFTSEADFNF